ncbi:hypothetical protein K491DRAFT_759029 [Lophiostoma macrostomum CBS 122681]|uniref:Uncharacterized protein n=1 Tax=Lophiostoma macrostomum CBS 122681 TaxID=1314788 RepID=A0A6A6T773_9PLEO|nr:hypothetical protein K491DRAFT_759029 [Lophiostoma macrostomum CBS 122681]
MYAIRTHYCSYYFSKILGCLINASPCIFSRLYLLTRPFVGSCRVTARDQSVGPVMPIHDLIDFGALMCVRLGHDMYKFSDLDVGRFRTGWSHVADVESIDHAPHTRVKRMSSKCRISDHATKLLFGGVSCGAACWDFLAGLVVCIDDNDSIVFLGFQGGNANSFETSARYEAAGDKATWRLYLKHKKSMPGRIAPVPSRVVGPALQGARDVNHSSPGQSTSNSTPYADVPSALSVNADTKKSVDLGCRRGHDVETRDNQSIRNAVSGELGIFYCYEHGAWSLRGHPLSNYRTRLSKKLDRSSALDTREAMIRYHKPEGGQRNRVYRTMLKLLFLANCDGRQGLQARSALTSSGFKIRGRHQMAWSGRECGTSLRICSFSLLVTVCAALQYPSVRVCRNGTTTPGRLEFDFQYGNSSIKEEWT